MVGYIYDGSFEGLLTAIYDVYYRWQVPEFIISQESYEHDFEGSLFAAPVEIATDSAKAEKVYVSIKKKISAQALFHVSYAFLSEAKGMEMDIYRYLRLGWKIGEEIDQHLFDRHVQQIHRLSSKVRLERHRMLGLLRFRLLNEGVYYGSFEPDHNIVALLAPHFAERMAQNNWVIHDVRRGIAALYNQQEWILTQIQGPEEIKFAQDEETSQGLWKEYFKSVAISGRINPRLQKRCMPKRYWKHLVEME